MPQIDCCIADVTGERLSGQKTATVPIGYNVVESKSIESVKAREASCRCLRVVQRQGAASEYPEERGARESPGPNERQVETNITRWCLEDKICFEQGNMSPNLRLLESIIFIGSGVRCLPRG